MSKYLACGRKRAKVKRLIQMQIDEAQKNQNDVAEMAGVSHQAVSATLSGYIHSRKVFEALRKIGVPEKYLFDPHQVVVPGATVEHETQERV